ncbi:MAG TPA: SAM-dependent methyltransferase [Actinocatenispora sp.]
MAASDRVVFSTAEESYTFAVRELRDAFGAGAAIGRLGPDLGVLDGPGVAEVAAACRDRPLVFPRHLTVEAARIDATAAADPRVVAEHARAAVPTGVREVAVQAWVSGSSTLGYGAGAVARAVTDELAAYGVTAARAGREWTVSCCLTADTVLVGLNRTADSLSDWPGGRVRLGRAPSRVSRSEFKLEELFNEHPFPVPARGRAVDFGASPGGWTRILRTRGFDVTAVDPGDLAPSLVADRHVTHARTTVGEFLRSNRASFDLAVNDMRMEPTRSCRAMLDVAGHLSPGAYAVVTLKTGPRRPVEQVDACLSLLRAEYDVVFARQLYHNRSELTVVVQRAQASTRARSSARGGSGRTAR